MKLTKLVTKNFKKLGSREFHFTEGLNFILGDNAAGKSTLTRAIGTALYGVSALPGLAEDVATWGSNSWALELYFETKGQSYLVRRTKSSARLECDGEVVAEGNSPVTEAVELLVGLNVRDYHLFIHSRQGETAYILSYGATALQRKVEEYSGVATIEELQRMARELGNQTARESESIVVQEVEGIEELQTEVNELKKELSEMNIVPPKESLQEVREGFRKYRNYLRDKENLETELKNLKERLDEIGELKEPAPIGDLSSDIVYLQRKKKTIEANRSRREQLEATLTKTVKELESLETPEKPKEVIISHGLQEEVTLLKEKIRLLKSRIRDGVCSSCGTVLNHDKDKDEAELGECEAELSRLEETLENEQSLVRTYNTLLTQYYVTKEKLETLSSAKEKAEEELRSCPEPEKWTEEETLQQMQLDLRQHNNVVEEYERQLTRKNGFIDRIDKLQSEIDDLEEVEEVTEEQVAEVEKLWDNYSSLISAKKIKEVALKSTEDKLDRLREEGKTEKQKAEKKKELGKKAEKYHELSKYLADRRQSYLTQVWDNILGKASDLVSYTTGGKITGIAIQDGKFLFEEQGAWIPTVEASGAQSAFIGSSLRIAMNSVLYSGNSFMVFDEPTADMTEDNSRALVAGISEASDQLFIVTHRSSDQGLAGNIVEV